MISLPHMAGQRLFILGLARSGLAAAAALRHAGAVVTAWDDAPARRETAADQGITLLRPDQVDWPSQHAVLLSPGIPHKFPVPHPAAAAAQAAGVPLISDIDLLIQARPDCRFVGITGTNGKSTTTALIAHILTQAGWPCQVGGNIGQAALGLNDVPAGATYILELSSYQLELMPNSHIDISVLLNITPDHLDRHGGMDGYIAAKTQIFANAPDTALAIISADDPYCCQISADLRAAGRRVIPLSVTGALTGGIWASEAAIFDTRAEAPEQIALALAELPRLPGRHNAQNIIAAIAAVTSLGLSLSDTISGLRSFPGLAHRQEFIGEMNGIRYINDSKATNADAVERALVCYENIYWIAGGVAKSDGIDPLAPYFDKIRRAYLIGSAAQRFAQTLGARVPHLICESLHAALAQAQDAATVDPAPSKVILLSPACAAFDQFRDFEDRGDQFRASVFEIFGRGVQ